MSLLMRFALLTLLAAQPSYAARETLQGMLGTDEAGSADAVLAANDTFSSIAGALLTQGTTIANRYKLTALLWPGGDMDYRFGEPEKLGQGQFGAAYLAEDGDDDQKLVVVKVFFTKDGQFLTQANARGDDDNTLYLWMASRECTAARLIQNARTDCPECRSRWMRCLDDGINHPGAAYAVYEYLGRTNLKEYMFGKGHITLNGYDMMVLTKQLIEGLVQIQGTFVHRDIKPDNIMIQVYGTQEEHTLDVKYIDFGLMTESGKAPPNTGGSRPYEPPEFIKNPSTIPTDKFDVWSLGMSLYEIICGATLLRFVEQDIAAKNTKWTPNQIWNAADQAVANGADPSDYCSFDGEESNLFWFIKHRMLLFRPAMRQDPVTLNSNVGWNGLVTTKGNEATEYPILDLGGLKLPPFPQSKPQQNELQRLLGPRSGHNQPRPRNNIFARQQKKQVVKGSVIPLKRDVAERMAQREREKKEKGNNFLGFFFSD